MAAVKLVWQHNYPKIMPKKQKNLVSTMLNRSRDRYESYNVREIDITLFVTSEIYVKSSLMKSTYVFIS